MKPDLEASRKQEERGAQRWGGKRVKGSGNGWVRKGDGYSEVFFMEYKRTDKGSYSIKATEVRNAEKLALMDGKIMLFGIELGGRDYYLLTAEDLVSLAEDK